MFINQRIVKRLLIGLGGYLLIIGPTTGCRSNPDTITVVTRNTFDAVRRAQSLTIPAAELREKLNQDDLKTLTLRENRGNPLPVQWVSEGTDSVLLFQADFKPHQTRTFILSLESGQAASFQSRVFGRFVPERKDDFAWENDRIAYRMYGPALQADGEISSGVDVWVKSTDSLVINRWYQPGFNYHHDHGQGLDGYKVGPSRGCGGLAVWQGGRLWPSKNYTSWAMRENGPLRVSFDLGYAPWQAGPLVVGEQKNITLDSGQNFNRFSSRFDWDGQAEAMDIAVGIVKRNGGEFRSDVAGGWMAYWEPEMEPNGHTACAVVLPPGSAFRMVETDDHYLLLQTVGRGGELSYYAGAGWSKSGRFDASDDWFDYVADFAADLKTPIQIQIVQE